MNLTIQVMRRIGTRLREVRRMGGLTQEQLAERSGYSPGYIGSVENARKVPSMSYLFDLADALCTTPSELLRGSVEGPDRNELKKRIKGLVDRL